MHTLFRIMLMYNEAMRYGVPPKKRKGEPVCIVPLRPGQVPEVVDLEVNIRERERFPRASCPCRRPNI